MHLRHFLTITCLCSILGCTSFTYERLLREGKITDFNIHSGHFEHRVFKSTLLIQESFKTPLYLYIGGDGRPWRTFREVASNPTSEHSIVLKSMLQAEPNSMYIGRPCYYQVADARCQGTWWTHDRYHPDVVNSLLKVVEQLSESHKELWLIGYSGGGTLAVLVGRRLNRPVNVVTVNANLDHQAWTNHHQYSPLTGSLNPIRDLKRNPEMRELHWHANQDRTVLPEWIVAYCEKTQTRCLPFEGSHTSWTSLWPSMLHCSQNVFRQSGNSVQAVPVPENCLRP